MKIKKHDDGSWTWRVEYEGHSYGEHILQQKNKPIITEEQFKEIAERKWEKTKALLEKHKTL